VFLPLHRILLLELTSDMQGNFKFLFQNILRTSLHLGIVSGCRKYIFFTRMTYMDTSHTNFYLQNFSSWTFKLYISPLKNKINSTERLTDRPLRLAMRQGRMADLPSVMDTLLSSPGKNSGVRPGNCCMSTHGLFSQSVSSLHAAWNERNFKLLLYY